MHAGRRAHWLELFFDLVMAAYIGQIAHTLHGDASWADALAFVAFLAAAWWAWANATITMNLFGARITRTIWAVTTVAMMAIGVMAVAVPEALGERAAAFAIGNAGIRLVWVLPWFLGRRATGATWWRPMVYSVLPAALWLVSIAVGPPWQYVLWGTAVAIEIALLNFLGNEQAWLRQTMDVDHLAERVGLLIVIVFGESILSIIAELNAHWTATSGVAAVLGFVAISMLAWIYFGYAASAVEHGLRRLQRRGSVSGLRDAVMYLPFLLVAGVTLVASALGTAVADAGHHLPAGAAVCLGAGISLFFVASAAESLRYGAPARSVLPWAPAGIVLPWSVVLVAGHVSAEVAVGVAAAVIAVAVGLTELNVRRATATA